MYILNIKNAVTEMVVKDLREFIFENCYKRIGLLKR